LTKLCTECSETKPVSEFYQHKGGNLYPRCKPCHYARTRAWRARNREKVNALTRARYPREQARKAAAKRLAKYGLTQDGYDALVASQGGVCAICLEPLPTTTLGMKSSDWNLPSVDHCHETGKVRGVLHRRCNLALEFLLSDDEAARAREYLRSNA
jgi:hypothetical protein